MKLAESFVIDQHIGKLLEVVETTNLRHGTQEAAALIVGIVREWASDIAAAPKSRPDGDVTLPIDLENAYGRAFRSTCLEAAKLACQPSDTVFWQRCDDGWIVDITSRGVSRAMQVMFVLGLEHTLSKIDTTVGGVTRIGLQDDMTFVGSAAALNHHLERHRGYVGEAGHKFRGDTCSMWTPRFEQFEDQALPHEIKSLCAKVPKKGQGIELLGSAAHVQYTMHVGLGQHAKALTQIVARLVTALTTLRRIERLACDQHDHVSFAEAHALDHDFMLVLMSPAAAVSRWAQANAGRHCLVDMFWSWLGSVLNSQHALED